MIKRASSLCSSPSPRSWGRSSYSKYRPTPDRVSGFIEADEIRLGSRVGGRVAKVLVEEGATVKRGDTLIELEPFDLLAEQERAKATLAASEAEYQRLKAGLRPEEVAQAEAHYHQLQATLDERSPARASRRSTPPPPGSAWPTLNCGSRGRTSAA